MKICSRFFREPLPIRGSKEAVLEHDWGRLPLMEAGLGQLPSRRQLAHFGGGNHYFCAYMG
jgi:hypothetical protein